MADVSLRDAAEYIHTESKREHGAAELKMPRVKQIVNTDGWKVYNRLSLNGIHHKRINHEKALANGEALINGLDSCRGYGKRRLSAYNVGFIRNDRLFIREISEKGRSDSAIATTKPVSNTCRIHRSTGPIRLHDALDKCS